MILAGSVPSYQSQFSKTDSTPSLLPPSLPASHGRHLHHCWYSQVTAHSSQAPLLITDLKVMRLTFWKREIFISLETRHWCFQIHTRLQATDEAQLKMGLGSLTGASIFSLWQESLSLLSSEWFSAGADLLFCCQPRWKRTKVSPHRQRFLSVISIELLIMASLCLHGFPFPLNI